ncbi:tellurite resistance methyltransferase TehB [Leminorella grimontii]|uniref:Tellurite resistance methyltransferase TehB n=1 Tax=Leminorella grimontii TaxID=82981 RepID=A0AAV5N6S6_9GAMM|nr:SAM-dependent methyltransferase TehB [Leminorella grimontii]KFC92880.1 tellurite resistance protein [Leminorella grimontii ATCC 33999 = DSM 5078]GKX56764.1 tellurite resistance methyltransferase TehB [Leminorella grimontii]VFS62253.1 Tellurite resistance protein TehB homolog [Leminorella grimontii]
MESLICYKEMPRWSRETIPDAFMQQHNTQAGTWAKLTVFRGDMAFAMLNEDGTETERFVFSPESQPPLVAPQAWHRIVSCSPDLDCQLAFYCQPEDYTQKKYGMTKTHSEVINAVRYVEPCKALDLGCGSGRNALYLNKLGFDVTAYDKNEMSIQAINDIIQAESLNGLRAQAWNINEQDITERYGFIFSTVVFMFLNRDRVPEIIRNMQEMTEPGGYNLIVSAMSTPDFPCPMPFSFTFSENELKERYEGWEIVKYNENVGELHKTDDSGQRIRLRFATLLAKKTV